jgi:hypothetical protein
MSGDRVASLTPDELRMALYYLSGFCPDAFERAMRLVDDVRAAVAVIELTERETAA